MSQYPHRVWVTVEGVSFLVEVGDLNQRPIRAVVEGTEFEVDPDSESGETLPVEKDREGFHQPQVSSHSIPGEMICEVVAPMPGDIVEILVKAGQPVQPGDPLCVLDAMKMKNTIHAPQAGVIQEVNVQEGQAVDYGVVLLRFA